LEAIDVHLAKRKGNEMKKLIIILGVFIAAAGFYGVSAQAESVSVNKVIEVPGANSEQLLDLVSSWAGRYAQSYVVDPKTGLVLASGEITYPSPPIDRIQYTIPFEMKNSIQGNKNTVTFEKVMLKSPTTYLPSDTGAGPTSIKGKLEPIESKSDIATANKVLTHIADNLESYLLKKSDAGCPLFKCPNCKLLCPSSEDMKEHMKTHEGTKVLPEHETAPTN
jgi:hypothetical protein